MKMQRGRWRHVVRAAPWLLKLPRLLDACRNNPWPETLHNGLAPITAIPRGTVVLYATAANDSTRKADIDMPAGVAGIVRMREAHRKGPEEKHDRSG